MQVHRGARTFDAVRVTDPADAAMISGVLRGATVQVRSGLVEVASAQGRYFARPGQWVVSDPATGTVCAMDDQLFLARHEVVA